MKRLLSHLVVIAAIVGFAAGCSSPSGNSSSDATGTDTTTTTTTTTTTGSLNLHVSFATLPDGVSATASGPYTSDVEVPTLTNTTGGKVYFTSSSASTTADVKSGTGLPGTSPSDATDGFIQGVVLFKLPTLQGPVTVKVNSINTGSSADGISRYVVITDASRTILYAGAANPRGSTSSLSMTETSYSYTGTGTQTLYVFASKNNTVGSTAVATDDVSLKYYDIYLTGNALSDTTAPAEVTGLNAAIESATSKVTLTWTPPADTDFAGVNISWTGAASGSATVASGTNTYTTTALANGNYTFTVKTKDASGNLSTGISTAAVTIASTDSTAPGDVTGLVATANANQTVTLTWTPPTDTDFSGVSIAWTGAATGATTVAAGTATYTTAALASGSYTFTVKTYDAIPNTSAGVSATATVVDVTAPANVTKLSANPYSTAGDTVVLSWTNPTTADFNGVKVSYNGLATPVTLAAGITTYTFTGLSNSTAYTFTVASFDNAATPNVASGTTVTATTAKGFLELFTTFNGAATTAQTIATAATYTLGNGITYVVGTPNNSKIAASATTFTDATSIWNVTLDKPAKPSSLVIPVTGNATIKVATKGTLGRDIAAAASGGGTLIPASFTLTGAAEEASFAYTGGAGSITLTTTNTTGAVPVYFILVTY